MEIYGTVRIAQHGVYNFQSCLTPNLAVNRLTNEQQTINAPVLVNVIPFLPPLPDDDKIKLKGKVHPRTGHEGP